MSGLRKIESGNSAEERLAEIASILTLGLMRLHARKSSQLSPETGESSLHFSPTESGHEPAVLTSGEGS
jgi:hypothetical protein